MESHLFTQVGILELLEQRWQKASKKHLAPNLCTLIDHFNSVRRSENSATTMMMTTTAHCGFGTRYLEYAIYI